MSQLKTKLTTIVLMMVLLLAHADSGQLYTSDKLASSLINCVVQDNYGYIWIGTEYGLSRFDGYRFTNYQHDSKDTTSIIDNTISQIKIDKSGHLWIGCAKGLMRYNYATNSFHRYNFPNGIQPRVYDIIQSHNGNILIGTAGYGLYSIKNNSNELTAEKEYTRGNKELFFTHIFEDSHGNLWQGSHLNTFYCYKKKNGKITVKNYVSPCGAPIAFFQSWKNQMMIICMFGIIYYDYTTDKIIEGNIDLGPYKGHITINSAQFDKQGNLYLGTSECGVLQLPAGSRRIIPYTNPNNEHFDLTTSWVNAILTDKDDNIWIGCYMKGLYLINNQQMAFRSWSFASQGYSIGTGVTSVARGDNGDIWCTVQNNGVYQFNKEGKIVSHPASPVGTCTIYRDKDGGYWITTGSALFSYNPYTGAYVEKLHFESSGASTIKDDEMGKLFISVYSKGLYIYDRKTKDITILNMSQKRRHGSLCNDWVRHMIVDRQGLLWIATSNGVACLNPQTLAFDTYGWTSILRNRQANYLCETTNGNIIIGTDDGLYIYNVADKALKKFPNSEILQNKQICGIVRDNHNDIWIGTTMGIWQYDHLSKKFIGHINGNGLKTHEYVLGAIMHCPDDLIAIGNNDGITVFYPEDVRGNYMEMNKVYLTNFIIDGKSVSCMSNEYDIPYSQNSFSLEFSLLNFRNASDICYEYRINGGEWISTNEGGNAISFTKMKPGSYDIEVRASNNGVYSKENCIIKITVGDPWYASTWALLIYLLLFIGIIIYILLSYEHRRKVELEEQKMKFLIDATHDIRSPLTLIMGPLKKLMARHTTDEDKQDLETIDHNAQRLMLLVNQILDERKIDKNQMHLHCTPTNLKDFIEGILTLYQYNANDRDIKLSVHSELPAYMVEPLYLDRSNFDKVVNNLLSNALKYTFDGGEITIILKKEEHQVIMQVMDTGIGFKQNTERLFERFYQERRTHNHFHVEGTGIGLNLCKAIVQLHGGSIKAYNRNDGKRGACIEIILPLGSKHLNPDEIVSEDSENQKKHHASANRNCNILIVDDDPEIAKYINNELSNWYRFDYANNGKEALRILLTGNYDLVISDIMMPEMDGLTLLKEIKRNSNISDIPVILLTSKSDVNNRMDGLKKGADAFLAKPFDMEELHILIDNLIDNVRRLKGKFSGALNQQGKVDKIEVKGNNNILMDRIMRSINDNIANTEFNVEALSDEVGISRAQLHRKMKEITGISTGEFIRNIRLEQAARLIKEGDINITQVAYSVGFNNQTHFSTAFKKHFGMTPSEYAEK